MNKICRKDLLQHAQQVARDIVAGSVAPVEGALRIHEDCVEVLDHPLPLQPWCALEAGLNPLNNEFTPLEGEPLDLAIHAQALLLVDTDLDELEREITSSWRSYAGMKWKLDLIITGSWYSARDRVRQLIRGPKGMVHQRALWIRNALKLVSVLLVASGVLIWCGVFIALVPVVMFVKTVTVVTLFLPLMAFIGNVLFDWGRRLGAKTAVEALNTYPGEAPVLYLRSFALDKVDEDEDEDESLSFRPQEEEILASIFKYIGPFVAVGDPQDALLRAGAARAYLSQDDWKVHVEALMARSSVVVLRVSDTRGFLWEAEQAVSKLPPERVLFYFSQHLSSEGVGKLYQALATRINPHLPLPLPTEIGDERFIQFDKDWRPMLFGSLSKAKEVRTWPRSAPVSAVLTRRNWRERLSLALRPFFATRQMFSASRSMFSDSTVLSASLLASPVSAGVMMARNLWLVDKRVLSILILAFALLLTAGLFQFLAWGGGALVQMVAERTQSITQYWTSSVWLLLVAYVFINVAFCKAWFYFGPRLVRQHLRFGGPQVRWWWSAALLLVTCAAWWYLISTITSWEMIP